LFQDDHFAAASRQNGWRRQADAQLLTTAAGMAEVAQEMDGGRRAASDR
jgi:hypothetical protein